MTRATRPKAVVFDLDGTLIDSLGLVLRAIAHGLEPFGAMAPADIFAKLGGPPERFLATLLGDARHVPVARARMEAFHEENWRMIQPFEGVLDFLAGLQAAGLQLAIWTGRDRVSTGVLLSGLKLDGFFATVLCGDDLASHKPDPEGLREILRRLGVRAHETIFVGDADVDVLGGTACGVETVLIRHEREIAPSITAKSWQSVISPREAFEAIRGRLK
ncbi:MAG: HAD family hydrolase [Opitutaceae bacterium]